MASSSRNAQLSHLDLVTINVSLRCGIWAIFETRPSVYCAKDWLGTIIRLSLWHEHIMAMAWFGMFWSGLEKVQSTAISSIWDHFRHGDKQTNTQQPGVPRASLLFKPEKAMFCNYDYTRPVLQSIYKKSWSFILYFLPFRLTVVKVWVLI